MKGVLAQTFYITVDNPDVTLHEYESDGIYRLFVISPTDKGDLIRLNVVIGRNAMECSIAAVGDRELVESVVTHIEMTYRTPKVITLSTLTGFNSDGAAVIKDANLRDDDTAIYLAKDAFYPGIGNGIKDLTERFSNSRSNVLILIGPPGTGKSTLLRSLMFHMKRKHNSAVNNEVLLNNPLTMQWMQTHEDDSLLIIEDADNLCRKRSDGNHQMSALLNHADGIVQSDCKIIISTNLPTLRDIDDALIRPGRAFGVLTFSELTVEQANEARASIGMGVIQNPTKRTYTLSEALHHEEGVVQKQSMGFN